MASPLESLQLASERLRSHELSPEALRMIFDVLDPYETPYEILVGVNSSPSRDSRPVITDEQLDPHDFETVVMTGERLMFFHDDQQHEIPLGQLRSIRVGDGVTLAKISFYTDEIQRTLEHVHVEDAHRFAEVASAELHLPVWTGSTRAGAMTASHPELEEIDALRRDGLITTSEWTEMRRPLLAPLGLEADHPIAHDETPSGPKTRRSVRTFVVIALVGLAALIFTTVLVIWVTQDNVVPLEPPQATVMPEEPSSPTPSPTASDTAGDLDQEAPAVEPRPETEESADTTAADDGPYGAESRRAFEAAIEQYLAAEGLETTSEMEISEEQIIVSLASYDGNTERSAIEVSADLAILVAEENAIIEEPSHDARVTVPVESGGVVAVNFDREVGQYAQFRE